MQQFDINEITQENFVQEKVKKLLLLKPLNEFMNRALEVEENF